MWIVELVHAAAAVLPLATVALVAATVWRWARGSTCAQALHRSALEAGIVVGTLPFVRVTLLPGPGAGYADGAVSLVPLRDLGTMSTFQVVGNLLVFAAFGLLAPLRFASLAPVWRVVALAALGSALIETLQHVLVLDRVSSIDDVLLNATGAGLAAALVRSRRDGAGPPAQRAPDGGRPGRRGARTC